MPRQRPPGCGQGMINASITSSAVTSVRCFCVQNRYSAAPRMIPKARYSTFIIGSVTASPARGQLAKKAKPALKPDSLAAQPLQASHPPPPALGAGSAGKSSG